uniref:Uncharacterized protein n=1 Tax=Equus caballus TaxID=9796 RepID=A0A9L0T743_HORSE
RFLDTTENFRALRSISKPENTATLYRADTQQRGGLLYQVVFLLDALRRRKAEAFFHLWVPFDSCHHFYGTLIFMYLRRPTEESVEQEEMAAVFYTTVIPMLNPMTCSLRNKDVKEAMNK